MDGQPVSKDDDNNSPSYIPQFRNLVRRFYNSKLKKRLSRWRTAFPRMDIGMSNMATLDQKLKSALRKITLPSNVDSSPIIDVTENVKIGNGGKVQTMLPWLITQQPKRDMSGAENKHTMEPSTGASGQELEKENPFLFCNGYQCADIYSGFSNQNEQDNQPVDCIGNNCPGMDCVGSNCPNANPMKAKRFICSGCGCGGCKRQTFAAHNDRVSAPLTPEQLETKRKLTCEPFCLRLNAEKRNLFCNLHGCRSR